MLQVHHAHLLLSLLPLHVLPPPPLLRPPRCCRRERTARAPSLVRSGCADAYMIAWRRAEGGQAARAGLPRRLGSPPRPSEKFPGPSPRTRQTSQKARQGF
ncbi:unnamed protein product [Prorocentrum cordatum]|uniref:Secreted protein n=1 Tax=Prorocentrum cordatum TaxID=2364126 RepID=A0ABN9SE76_9DINO|nr:unnamed protein product [Polarella glacialis]